MLLLIDLVVDDNRAVDELPHPRQVASGAPYIGKAAKQIDVIEQGLAKAGKSTWAITFELLLWE